VVGGGGGGGLGGGGGGVGWFNKPTHPKKKKKKKKTHQEACKGKRLGTRKGWEPGRMGQKNFGSNSEKENDHFASFFGPLHL